MNPANSKTVRHCQAFTLPELLLVMVAVAVLVLLALAKVGQQREKANRIKCVGNLKSSALSLKIFASDNGDRYPYQLRPPLLIATPQATFASTNITQTNVSQAAVWGHWLLLSNETGSPKVLLCNGNRAKRNSIASDWTSGGARGFLNPAGLTQMTKVDHTQDLIDYEGRVGYDLSISYWLSLSADETIPAGVLMGDANLNWTSPVGSTPDQINPALAGVQPLTRPDQFANVRFVEGRASPVHYRHHIDGGNLALTDGSVMQLRNVDVAKTFQVTTNALTNNSVWLVLPK